MTGRGHQLIHSDAFAAELEAMGLDQSIFGPHLPAPIFQALVPRKAGVFDEHAHTFGTGDEPATFARASDGIYLDADGDYKVATAAAIRAEYDASGNFLGYLFEPAITNKCTNYNASPDSGLSNMTKGGDAAAVFSRIEDNAALQAAGLFSVGNGYAFDLDNSGGATNAIVSVDGFTGNTNTHTLTCFMRRVSGTGDYQLRWNTGSDNTTGSSAVYERVALTSVPGTTAYKLMVLVEAGTRLRFILNQLEESAVVTSPIITLGASGTRATDTLTWGALAGFSDAEGGIRLCWRPAWGLSDIAAGSAIKPDLWKQTSGQRGAFWQHTVGGISQLMVRDGSGTFKGGADIAPGPVSGTAYDTFMHWSAALSEFEIGIKVASVWQWPASPGVYGGTMADDQFQIGVDAELPMHLMAAQVFNRYLTQAEITRLFP